MWAAAAITAQGSKIQRGAEVAPVPLNMNGLNPALVREGSYIVNAQGGCNDCHTVPSYAAGGDPFQGQPELINAACYLAGGAAFGPFVSRNLTPRANGLPAGRTLDEFKQIMHTGANLRATPDGTPILQVMPWPVHGKMSDRELAAIYEFLRAERLSNDRRSALWQVERAVRPAGKLFREGEDDREESVLPGAGPRRMRPCVAGTAGQIPVD